MTHDVSDPMGAEFGTVAEWTARVAADLGPEYYIPAACRGSGQPAVLDWLLDRLEPRRGEIMIDVGAGVGGPAAFAAQQTGVQPILAEPEPGACRAAARLFGAPLVQADATCLPFGTATADLAWCLGVLCTASGTAAQQAMLTQLRRIIRRGGRIGLLVYLTVAELDNPPQGNHFPSSSQLHDLFGQAGLQAVEVASIPGITKPPPDWTDRFQAVEDELHRRYGHTPELKASDEQSDRIGALLSTGQLTSQVILLRAP
ncbi:MAG TPA: class I SAM-dependent methyltransferase [Streptosporangiaceae bacterium]|jgi:SAM-dependent methyltransferase